jgi:hypothetical protein
MTKEVNTVEEFISKLDEVFDRVERGVKAYQQLTPEERQELHRLIEESKLKKHLQ